jgi:hypothetical protein
VCSEYLAGHLEVGGRAVRGGWRRREKAAMVDRCGRKTKLTARPHLAERCGRGGQLGRREPKGKMYSREDATDAQARWAGQGSFGLRGQRGQRAGWAKGRVGRKVGRTESKEKRISELKIGFLNLPRLWKFVEGDLGGILM